MVAFNFNPQFIEYIQLGYKVATVRKTMRCKVGDKIQFYTGQRTKNCEKFGEGTCLAVGEFIVDKFPTWQCSGDAISELEKLNDFSLHNQLGFTTLPEMVEFYKQAHGLPFKGFIHVFKFEG